MTSPIVTGFNCVVGCVNYVAGYIPGQVTTPIHFLAKKLPADGFKTFVAKSLHLSSLALSHLEQQTNFPILERLAADGSRTKSLICGLEIITKFPAMIKALSTPVDGPEDSRKYAVNNGMAQLLEDTKESAKSKLGVAKESGKKLYKKVKGEKSSSSEQSPKAPSEVNVVKKSVPFKMVKGPALSEIEVVSSRVFHVANWFIAVADVINLVKLYRPNLVDRATPWIYAVAGGYMAMQGLYTDWKYNQVIWANKDTATAEKYFGYLNIATSIGYLFSSTAGALAIYFKNQKPAWFGKYQFAANVGIVLFPLVQSCAKEYMTDVIWPKTKS